MKLTEMQVKQFCEVLASDAPAPGGGSAAALTGAMGIGLAEMVANLTIGKKKYAEFEENAQKVKQQAAQLCDKMVESIDKDTEAFDGVSAVFSMPKDTDEQKAARSAAMQAALKDATLVPFSVMELCLESLLVVEAALGKSNTSAASDLGVASLNLKAAVQGAWLNVLINLGGIKDADFVQKYKAQGQEILDKALPLADKIYSEIVASL